MECGNSNIFGDPSPGKVQHCECRQAWAPPATGGPPQRPGLAMAARPEWPAGWCSGGVALPPGDGGPSVVAGGLQGDGGLGQSEWLWAAKFGEPRLLADVWELHTRGQW